MESCCPLKAVVNWIDYLVSEGQRTGRNELTIVWKEAVIVYFQKICSSLSGQSEQNHEHYRQRFKPGTPLPRTEKILPPDVNIIAVNKIYHIRIIRPTRCTICFQFIAINSLYKFQAMICTWTKYHIISYIISYHTVYHIILYNILYHIVSVKVLDIPSN
jgi:hypothetical protein